MHTVALRESEITDLIREGFSLLMRAEASIMRFKTHPSWYTSLHTQGDFRRPQR